MSATYVVMLGDTPQAVATTLAAAQAAAVTSMTKYRTPELRWDEHREGTWRLMSRTTDRGRFAWSCYAVHATPVLDAAGGES